MDSTDSSENVIFLCQQYVLINLQFGCLGYTVHHLSCAVQFTGITFTFEIYISHWSDEYIF